MKRPAAFYGHTGRLTALIFPSLKCINKIAFVSFWVFFTNNIVSSFPYKIQQNLQIMRSFIVFTTKVECSKITYVCLLVFLCVIFAYNNDQFIQL